MYSIARLHSEIKEITYYLNKLSERVDYLEKQAAKSKLGKEHKIKLDVDKIVPLESSKEKIIESKNKRVPRVDSV